MSVSVCMFALSTLRVTKFLLKNFTTTTTTIYFLPLFWQRLVGFGFRVQHVGSTMQNLRRVGENYDPILSCLWTKVYEIFGRCRKPVLLSKSLFRLSVSRFVQKIFAIKFRSCRKTEQMQTFCGPQFLWGTAPTFRRQFVRTIDYPLLSKVWLSSVC